MGTLNQWSADIFVGVIVPCAKHADKNVGAPRCMAATPGRWPWVSPYVIPPSDPQWDGMAYSQGAAPLALKNTTIPALPSAGGASVLASQGQG